MTKCDTCGLIENNPVGYTRNFCDSCVSDKEIGNTYAQDRIFLKGYGHESLKRICEMERRTILPYEKKGGGYYLGRIGENGKIQERHPTY